MCSRIQKIFRKNLRFDPLTPALTALDKTGPATACRYRGDAATRAPGVDAFAMIRRAPGTGKLVS